MLALKTILHPTDFSPRSEYAFQLACSLAKDHGGRIVVLHVATPAPIVTSEGVINEWNYGDYTEKLWPALNRIVCTDPAVKVERRLETGEPSHVILTVAQELPADVIVLGTHGKRGLERLLLGSVAEEILRKADCPVLTVKAPKAVQAKPAAASP